MKKEELKQLALACKSSEEFAERASKLDGLALYREIWREFKGEEDEETRWKVHDHLVQLLKQRADCKGLWYETWIDLSDNWEIMWPTLRLMGEREQLEVCAKFLNEQERFYDSKDYIDMLNTLL